MTDAEKAAAAKAAADAAAAAAAGSAPVVRRKPSSLGLVGLEILPPTSNQLARYPAIKARLKFGLAIANDVALDGEQFTCKVNGARVMLLDPAKGPFVAIDGYQPQGSSYQPSVELSDAQKDFILRAYAVEAEGWAKPQAQEEKEY